jgi:hypothetical protein
LFKQKLTKSDKALATIAAIEKIKEPRFGDLGLRVFEISWLWLNVKMINFSKKLGHKQIYRKSSWKKWKIRPFQWNQLTDFLKIPKMGLMGLMKQRILKMLAIV